MIERNDVSLVEHARLLRTPANEPGIAPIDVVPIRERIRQMRRRRMGEPEEVVGDVWLDDLTPEEDELSVPEYRIRITQEYAQIR